MRAGRRYGLVFQLWGVSGDDCVVFLCFFSFFILQIISRPEWPLEPFSTILHKYIKIFLEETFGGKENFTYLCCTKQWLAQAMYLLRANSCFSDSFIISILSWGVWDTVRYPKLFISTPFVPYRQAIKYPPPVAKGGYLFSGAEALEWML